MEEEGLESILAEQMQSFAKLILDTLLDERRSTSSNHGNFTEDLSVCRNQLVQVSSAALKQERWALSVFDSNGKVKSGLMSGSLFNSLGSFDQCLRNTSFQYCLIQWDLSRYLRPLVWLLQEPHFIQKPAQVSLGVCVPNVCTETELNGLSTNIMNRWSKSLTSISVNQIRCQNNQVITGKDFLTGKFGFGLTACIITLIVIVSACVGATLLDLCKRKAKRKRMSQSKSRSSSFIEVFSLSEACSRLFIGHQRGGKPKYIDLKPLNGIRVVSMVWIIFMHSYFFAIQWMYFDNVGPLIDVFKSVWLLLIANGSLAVDNFFLISGFLAQWKSQQQQQTPIGQRLGPKRKLSDPDSTSQFSTSSLFRSSLNSIHQVIVRQLDRYLRLAPTLFFMILLSVNLLPHIANGPNYQASIIMFEHWCRSNWPINMSMMQNLFNTPNMCFGHSWFVAADFQMHAILCMILAIVELIYVRCNFNLKKISISTLIVASQFTIAVIVYWKKLAPIPLVPGESPDSIIKFQSEVYIKPYYWLSSYLIGALLAICLKAHEKMTRHSVCPKVWKTYLAQIIPYPTMILLVLFTLPFFNGTLRMSSLYAVAVALLFRPLWSISMALLIFSLTVKTNSITKSRLFTTKIAIDILSCDIWLPLSKLTYGAYLIHPVVMAVFYGSQRNSSHFSQLLMIYFSLGHIIISYACSLVIYLILEAPSQKLVHYLGLKTESQASKPIHEEPSRYTESIELNRLSLPRYY